MEWIFEIKSERHILFKQRKVSYIVTMYTSMGLLKVVSQLGVLKLVFQLGLLKLVVKTFESLLDVEMYIKREFMNKLAQWY